MNPTYYTPIVAAFIGALNGWLFTWLTPRKHKKIDMVLDLYERFHVPEMLESRIRAEQILKLYSKQDQTPDLKKVAEDLCKEEIRRLDWIAVSRVRHFLAQLQILLSQDKLDRNITERLFGEHVRFWFKRHFEKLERDMNDPTPHWCTTRRSLQGWADKEERKPRVV